MSITHDQFVADLLEERRLSSDEIWDAAEQRLDLAPREGPQHGPRGLRQVGT